MTGDQLGEQSLEPVDDLDPQVGQLVTTIGEHPQRLELTITGKDSQARGADSDDRDRVCVQRVGLAVVAGVEEPHPGRQLGRHVDNMLAGLDKALRE